VYLFLKKILISSIIKDFDILTNMTLQISQIFCHQ